MLRSLLITNNYLLHSTVLQKINPIQKVCNQNVTSMWQCIRHYTNMPNQNKLTGESEENQLPLVTDIDKKRKILELELEVMRQEGRKVPTPSKLKEEHWQHLLQLSSRNQRRQYYLFRWNVEMAKESSRLKKERKKEHIAKRKEELTLANVDNDHIIYGLFHNTMFLRIYDSAMDHFNNNKLIQAMRFGQNLVFDCSYDEYMNEKEMRNTAKQLMLCFAINRLHNEPFNIHHCNVDFNRTTMKSLEKHLVQIREPSFPFNITEKSYLDLFPRERLVYLTPHCNNDLKEFSPDDVYIVGAMVDKSAQENISLGKAKKLGLRMARLPLDNHFQFKGGKSLTIDQMLQILLELKTSRNFEKAFEHVPRRKIVTMDELQMQTQQRLTQRKEMGKFKFSMGGFSDRKIRRR
ncbi:mitochondrial ribonuclease P protein 1 homolog [Topomyia yanbarensis]|uniref:mitochondrial ribonuclease P protein 1 homolog n=1 Tax=Topomyia yanbarensis TaxID=2498891 RepID=UPI00273BD981|nr:mitochondrial ribonuclease P protein 1 homolog [Topomyia yanbarensis]XP_058835469.1 mitochondrial ribonuclease P protein 1 homolog [Topomyia yanbarensis]